MYTKHKVPFGISSMATLMNMHEAEVREWPYMKDMRAALKDYNLGAISTDQLSERLNAISIKCAEQELYHYCQGIDKAISAIKLSY